MTNIELLAEKINQSSSISILTGAGVSKASGVPTFRGEDGLWKSRRAEELATPQAFSNDPEFVWQWYDWRRELISKCEPNAAHEVISEWSKKLRTFLLLLKM